MEMSAIEQLQWDAPELYHTILNRGILMERNRVLAHLRVAKMYNSLREAIEAIEHNDPVSDPYPYESLHDHYAAIEDERDRLEEIAGW